MGNGSEIGRSLAATAGPRRTTEDPAGKSGGAGRSRHGTNRRALGTRETSRTAAKLSPRRLLSAPGRSDLDSHPPPSAPLSRCPPTGSAGSAARSHRNRRGLHGRRSLAALPRPSPPPSTIAFPGAPHGPKRSRSRAARVAPHWLPPQERAGAARPHCPPRPGEYPPSSPQRTGRGPDEPARRRVSTPLETGSGPAFPPHRPPPSGFHLPAGQGSHGGLCLPAVLGARPAQPSPGPPRPEPSMPPAGGTAARTAAPGRGRLPRPRPGLGGRRCSCRLRAGRAAGSLALSLEQWGQDHAGRGAGRTGVGAAPLRRRLLSPGDRRHHAAAPFSLPLPRSDGNPGRDVSPAPWDRPAAGGGASGGGDEQQPRHRASHSTGGAVRSLWEVADWLQLPPAICPYLPAA